jgi:hypothetical protein
VLKYHCQLTCRFSRISCGWKVEVVGVDKRICRDESFPTVTLYLSIAVVSLVFRLSLRSYDASARISHAPSGFVRFGLFHFFPKFSEGCINASLQVNLPIAQKMAPRVANCFLVTPTYFTAPQVLDRYLHLITLGQPITRANHFFLGLVDFIGFFCPHALILRKPPSPG